LKQQEPLVLSQGLADIAEPMLTPTSPSSLLPGYRWNSNFIEEGLYQSERLTRLNQIAISQMRILLKDKIVEKIGDS